MKLSATKDVMKDQSVSADDLETPNQPEAVKMPNESPKVVGQHEKPEIVKIPDELSKAVAGKLEQGLDKSEEKEVTFSMWDFAGQELYYSTHQVFISRRAVMMVVFYLEEGFSEGKLDNHFLENLDFWMQSIYAFTSESLEQLTESISSQQDQLSPPILIVGTHKKGLAKKPAVRDEMVKQIFMIIGESLEGKCYSKHVVREFFAIENSIGDKRVSCVSIETAYQIK
ncbi:probable serine/threonine-protein kinase qkgA [Amphiura filiformis]|uniref:probable serine/threonine-protein kinase qkgA n=1 Tax=Amphiura filiformis TaxID=82378 RepID=UPI003B21E4C5